MAALFDTTRQNAVLHLRDILPDGELAGDSVIKESLRTAADAKACRTKFHSLDAVPAVGCRVRSPRSVQLRRWATSTLKAYLVKNFVIDGGRLKHPASARLDELLERICGIRALAARLDQKLRERLAARITVPTLRALALCARRSRTGCSARRLAARTPS